VIIAVSAPGVNSANFVEIEAGGWIFVGPHVKMCNFTIVIPAKAGIQFCFEIAVFVLLDLFRI
jgi:hypothetical protein